MSVFKFLRDWLYRDDLDRKRKPQSRRFHLVFRSTDGSMTVEHRINRSELQRISDELAICAVRPQIGSLTIIAMAPERKGS